MKTNRLLITIFIGLLLVFSILYFEFPIQVISPVFYNDVIEIFSKQYSVDPLFITSIIKEESNFSIKAHSRSGAIGLMQIMPPTAKELADELGINNLNPENIEDPFINIRLGTYYVSKLLKEFNGNMILTLAAYNAGINKVRNWQKQNPLVEMEVNDIPYKETSSYIKSVMRTYKWLKWVQELKNLIRNHKTS
ncbi:MAG: lytic transglycosylase domain-containing protein [Elusimicrobia bacterium]|nr:lytic transglycosylase domain-containing protein [Candidatus Liberimonas magnetica]